MLLLPGVAGVAGAGSLPPGPDEPGKRGSEGSTSIFMRGRERSARRAAGRVGQPRSASAVARRRGARKSIFLHARF